ncbi:MAG: EscU/YscU/HrcU family type III secretion system export apparatus switch protein [Alphaproteobacteria bacterium]|nr:EscU/YscU/HrcU family type III secretion system export apparatus switch protein [Alphaproteobacteria bacterium]
MPLEKPYKRGGRWVRKQAVALSYRPDDAHSAPEVVASGEGHLAERILDEAFAADVPVREDADLVEILAATEVGQEIPVEAFVAVAEILRYVYERNGGPPEGVREAAAGGPFEPPEPPL